MKSHLPFISHGTPYFSKRPEKILLLCWYDPRGVSTVIESILYIQQLSHFPITVLNLFEYKFKSEAVCLPPFLNLSFFDGIIIHNSISYSVENIDSLDRFLNCKLASYSGLKVLFKQDENFRCQEMAAHIGKIGYDIVFTCLPLDATSLVYPEHLAGKPHFIRMLTGYVTPHLRQFDAANHKRPIDIGYRGSIQPLFFGRLSYEKRKIGDDMLRLSRGKLQLNISSQWEDRLFKKDWLEFLASCKAVLGVESGGSIFDLQGDLNKRIAEIEAKLGPACDDIDYIEAYLDELAELESIVYYNQIAPRHFEAAATKTLQIMYPGTYSGIFIPERHYITLNKDYSNLSEVEACILDDKIRAQITECAYEEIIQNPKYWVETFVQELDEHLHTFFEKKFIYKRPIYTSASNNYKNVLLLVEHVPQSDVRLSQLIQGALLNDIKIMPFGVSAQRESLVLLEKDYATIFQLKAEEGWTRGALDHYFYKLQSNLDAACAWNEVKLMEYVLSLSEMDFCSFLGASYGHPRNHAFRCLVSYVLNLTFVLLSKVTVVNGLHAVIATDLPTLITAILLKGLHGIPVVYDARVYWPEVNPSFQEFESQFWSGLERRLVQLTDFRHASSSELAANMTDLYTVSFNYLPNQVDPVEINKSLQSSMRKGGLDDLEPDCSWEEASHPFYVTLNRLIQNNTPCAFELYDLKSKEAMYNVKASDDYPYLAFMPSIKNEHFYDYCNKQYYFMESHDGDNIERFQEKYRQSLLISSVKICRESRTYLNFGFENAFNHAPISSYVAGIENENCAFVEIELDEPTALSEMVVTWESESHYAKKIEITHFNLNNEVETIKYYKMYPDNEFSKLKLDNSSLVKKLYIEFSDFVGQPRLLLRQIALYKKDLFFV